MISKTINFYDCVMSVFVQKAHEKNTSKRKFDFKISTLLVRGW